jgi:hypothetical protein
VIFLEKYPAVKVMTRRITAVRIRQLLMTRRTPSRTELTTESVLGSILILISRAGSTTTEMGLMMQKVQSVDSIFAKVT